MRHLPAMGGGRARSALAQTLLGVAQDRREQVIDDPPRSRPDLDGDGHAGRVIDELVVDLHLGLVERYARRESRLRRASFTGARLLRRLLFAGTCTRVCGLALM